MDKPVKYPGYPSLPANIPPELREWCERMQQIVDIAYGISAKNTNSRFVTIHDLVEAGVVADGVIK